MPIPSNDLPPFSPHPLLRNGHLQTVLSGYFGGRSPPYQARQQLVELKDGDRIVLHDDCPQHWIPGHRVALLIHGVAGSHLSPYQVRIAGKLNAAGIRTFRMDLRGCGAAARLARRPGHAGRSEDAAAAVRAITRECTSPITMIGFSLGGNIALKLMGESGVNPPGRLDSCIAVAPPIDLTCCAHHIERGVQRIYSRSFANTLVRQIRRHQHPDAVALVRRNPPKSIVQFDEQVTAPLSGFRNASEYYRDCSAAPFMSEIVHPTVILAAGDDPVVPVEMFRRASLSESTRLIVTRHGGHVAYIGKVSEDPDRCWLDWRIVDWVSAWGAGA